LAEKDSDAISKLPTEEIMEEAFPQISEDARLALISSLADLLSGFSFKKRKLQASSPRQTC